MDSVLQLGANKNRRWPRVNRGDSVGQQVMAPHDVETEGKTVLNNHKWKRINTLEEGEKSIRIWWYSVLEKDGCKITGFQIKYWNN